MTATNIYQNNVEKKSAFRAFLFEHGGFEIITVLLFFILPFIVGFILSAVAWDIPLTEQQYKEMEKAAYSVYEQKLNDAQLYEIPEDYKLTITDTTIIVSHKNSVGVVEARLKDGKLITTRDKQNSLLTFHHIAVGIIFAVFGGILLVVLCYILQNF